MYGRRCVCPGQYRYTKDGSFVKVDQNGRMTADRETVYFEEKNGKVYLRTDKITVYPGLEANPESQYSGEKMAEHRVSENVQKSWDALSQTAFAVCNEKWSSQTYENPFVRVRTDAEIPGYLLTVSSTGLTQSYKIKDEHSARFFATIPSSANRDLYDMEQTERTFADGTTSSVSWCTAPMSGTQPAPLTSLQTAILSLSGRRVTA